MVGKDVSIITSVVDSPDRAPTYVALLARTHKDLQTRIMDIRKSAPFAVAFSEQPLMPTISTSVRTMRNTATHIGKRGERNAWIY